MPTLAAALFTTARKREQLKRPSVSRRAATAEVLPVCNRNDSTAGKRHGPAAGSTVGRPRRRLLSEVAPTGTDSHRVGPSHSGGCRRARLSSLHHTPEWRGTACQCN